jgi:putative methionine-R-sulfoxide reductase with GAF domain
MAVPKPANPEAVSRRMNRSVERGLLALGWGSGLLVAALLGMLALGAGPGPWTLGTAVAALALKALQLFLWERYRAASLRRSLRPAERLSRQPLDYLVSLLNVTRAVSSKTSVAELGQVIVDSCLDCFDCEEASLMMLDRANHELVVTAFSGHQDVSLIRNARVRLGESVAGTVAMNRTPLILGEDVDARRFPAFQPKRRHIHSSMVAPVVVRERVVGVLNVSTGNPMVNFTEDDLRVLCIFAEHAGIVAAKARDGERVVRLVGRIRRRLRSDSRGSTGGVRRAA